MQTNAVVPINEKTSLVMSEDEMIDVLQSSLYPGAALKSIKMVLGYCKAANLDPMQKPVHIVPMWDKNAKAMRDVIMPGIGLYRTQATRSNELAGISKPAFGQMVTLELDGLKITVPDSCEVTVKRRMPSGEIAEYTAEEFWIENYATAGKDSIQPNAMWKKRPRGQLAKCAQAQALRMAFPEMVGSALTADEMEGKHIDASEIDITPKDSVLPKPDYCSAEKFSANKDAWKKVVTSGRKTALEMITFLETKALLTDEQKKEIKGWSVQQAEPAAEAKPSEPAGSDPFTTALDASGDYTPE